MSASELQTIPNIGPAVARKLERERKARAHA